MHKTPPKVTLKSDLYKNTTRTPQRKTYNTSSSRSPIANPNHKTNHTLSSQRRVEEEKNDPTELFQKVCCPNCRYVFKVIKAQNATGQVPKKNISFNPESAAQTEESVRALINSAQEQLRKEKNLVKQPWPLLSNLEGSAEYGGILEVQMIRSRSRTYSFQEASNQQMPKNTIRQRKKSLAKISLMERSARSERETPRKAQLGSFLGRWLMGVVASEKTMAAMQEAVLELPQEIQLPSYQKALLNVGQ